jgi:hypothetical protein
MDEHFRADPLNDAEDKVQRLPRRLTVPSLRQGDRGLAPKRSSDSHRCRDDGEPVAAALAGRTAQFAHIAVLTSVTVCYVNSCC